MRPERWEQIDNLLQSALARVPRERSAFLAQACADDELLRREVESLIASHEDASNFLETPMSEIAADLLISSQARLRADQKIGQYKIIDSLGAGGMGEVYLAEDTRLHRKVAIKVLPAELASNRDRMRRFEQEAKAAAALNHPQIAHIYEIREAEGVHFIAMEYIDGETLHQRTRTGMKLTEILDIATQTASALAAAHAAGIIHRDIKPENIMVRHDGYIKVLDFGLVKLTRPSGSCTDTEVPTKAMVNTGAGTVMGTAAYMSPEQARGLPVDERTDIWSLGVVLYEMASGRAPFEGETPSHVIVSILESEPPPLSRDTEVPPELERIVSKALRKEREQRYQTTKDLMLDLQSLKQQLEFEAKLERSVPPEPKRTTEAVAKPGRVETITQRTVEKSFPFLQTRWRFVTLAVAFVGALVLLGFGINKWRARAPVNAGPTQIRSLAVLPLENLSGDPSQEYFADGMTDALIGDLARVKGLQVISRTSAMHYKGVNKPLREIASELRVDAVIEGTVQRSGDHVLIRAQLIQAATEQHLWSETYERDLRDVSALQSEIAHAIVREIQIKIMPAERARLTTNRPVNRKAFDDYLQGRFLYWNRRTAENLHKAVSFFQSAVNADPTYAPAYVGLADCYNSLGTEQMGELPPMYARGQAEEAARKALEIDNEMPEAHVALGFVKHYNWDWAGAEQEFKLAIELNPNYAYAHDRYASLLVSEGRVEEAIVESNRAQELDPFSLAISSQRGFILENARRYDDAIEQLRRVIAMDQNNYQAHWFLGHTYAVSGRFAEAIAASEKAAALSSSPGALGFLGMSYGLAGRKAEANKILNELLELKRHRYVRPPALANVYIGLGNKDQAFFWLEKAYQDRSNYLAYLKVFPGCDSLRSDRRFDDLLRRLGLAS